jgi:hypothetical protein
LAGDLFGVILNKVEKSEWKTICQPRNIECGISMKLAWGVVTSEEALWVKVIKAKYFYERYEGLSLF